MAIKKYGFVVETNWKSKAEEVKKTAKALHGTQCSVIRKLKGSYKFNVQHYEMGVVYKLQRSLNHSC